jgi:hypothetical protein
MAVLGAIVGFCHLAISIDGFTNQQLVERVSQLRIDAVYNSRHATYDLRLFCTFCGSRSGPSGLLPLAGEGGGRKEVLSGARPRPSVPLSGCHVPQF